MRRLFIITMALAISLISLGIAGTSPALAANCWADGCNGYDPEYMNCADSSASNLETVTAVDGVSAVTLRYSGDCDAVWARGNHYWVTIEVQGSYDQVNIVNAYDLSEEDRTDDVDWSYMVSFGEWTRACVEAYSSNQWTCTGWH